ncbi:MAG: hypothetical protein ACRDAX_02245 [Propionibacteriaceae bacterium]
MTMNTAAAYVARALSQTSPWAFGAQRKRAIQLLFAGSIGAFVVAIPCIACCTAMVGRVGLLSSFVAAAVVVIFFTIGQAVQIAIVAIDLKQGFLATLFSYVVRVSGLAYGLYVAMRLVDAGVLHANSIAFTVISVMFGWIFAEIMLFKRMRFPLYDVEYLPPSQGEV